MRNFANYEDPDEMSHNAAFHQGLHSLLSQKWSSAKEIQIHLENITHDPSILVYTMDHPKIIVTNQKEESISASRVKKRERQCFMCILVFFR